MCWGCFIWRLCEFQDCKHTAAGMLHPQGRSGQWCSLIPAPAAPPEKAASHCDLSLPSLQPMRLCGTAPPGLSPPTSTASSPLALTKNSETAFACADSSMIHGRPRPPHRVALGASPVPPAELAPAPLPSHLHCPSLSPLQEDSLVWRQQAKLRTVSFSSNLCGCVRMLAVSPSVRV